MAELNWGRAAAGFVGGALSGYQAVLTSKMKEDSENRMEEARLMRQKNFAQWQDETITDPNRKEERSFLESQQERGFTHAEGMQASGFTHAEKMRAMSEGSAERRHKESLASQREQLSYGDKVYEGEMAKSRAAEDANRKLADNIASGIKDPEKAEAAKAIVRATGATTREEFHKATSTVAVDKEKQSALYSTVRKAQEEAASTLETMSPKDIRSKAHEMGASKEVASNPSAARSFILAEAGASQGRAFLGALGSGAPEDKGSSPPPPSNSANKPTGVSKEDWSNNLAEGIRRQNSEAMKVYNTLSPREQKDIDRRKNDLQRLEEEKFIDNYNKRASSGVSTLSEKQGKYLTPNSSQGTLYIPMPK
jgi:hypothetical protein